MGGQTTNDREFEDRSLVMLAVMGTQSYEDNGQVIFVPGQVEGGLRVVAHLRAGIDSDELHFVGCSICLHGGPTTDASADADTQFHTNITNAIANPALLDSIPGLTTRLTGSGFNEMRFASFSRSFNGADGARIHTGSATSVDASRSRAFPITFEHTFTYDTSTQQTSVVSRPLVTHALEVVVLKQDLASAGSPSELIGRRPGGRLGALTSQAPIKLQIPPDKMIRVPGDPAPKHSLRQLKVEDLFEVLYSDRPVGMVTATIQVRFADLNKPAEPMSAKFAAINAYSHTADFFETLRDGGFDARQYFSQFQLPLQVIPRSAIWPTGIDGETVNAQVNVAGNWAHANASAAAWTKTRPKLEVRFAHANLLANRARMRGTSEFTHERLGLATDPRWAWHEFGHVLIAAATGELELRFAHSVGDALAAIRSDPKSQLATEQRLRGLTFPWVALTRRHDRCARDGWGWEGLMHQPSAFWSGGPNQVAYKGYASEQILSSSLFRLYRALGGDTVRPGTVVPDQETRQQVSDYVCYLIIRALALLGPARIVPADSVDQFVSALIDADIGTKKWRDRFGGTAHKVICWAFQTQGLSTLAREVDLFIPSRRSATGAYEPVSLDAQALGWLADDQAITFNASTRTVSVNVHNGGIKIASNVETSVWVLPNKKDATGWVALKAPSTQVSSVLPGQASTFVFDATTVETSVTYWVFAATNCPEDRSIHDERTGLPCAWPNGARVVDLVVGDNNLALTKLTL